MVDLGKPMITLETRQILAWGSAITAIILGLTFLKLIPVDIPNLTNSILLFVLGTVLFSETYFEQVRRTGTFKLDVTDAIQLLISITAYIAGIALLLYPAYITFPETINGVIGFLYIMLAGAIVVELYT